MDNLSIKQRKKARRFAMQALYQWEMSANDLNFIEAQYIAQFNMGKVDLEYFRELLYQIPKNLSEVDSTLETYLDRELKELNPVEKNVLRIGIYELTSRIDVPYKVVIYEAVSLAREFGAQDGHKYVNGVLDKAASKLRGSEFKDE